MFNIDQKIFCDFSQSLIGKRASYLSSGLWYVKRITKDDSNNFGEIELDDYASHTKVVSIRMFLKFGKIYD